MPTITVAVPEELKRQMDAMDDVNWSAVARKSFEERIRLWNLFEKVAKTSTMTEEEAVKLGQELKRGTYQKEYAPRLQRERPLRRNTQR